MTETETLPVKPPTSNDQILHALCKPCDERGRHQAICGAGNAGKERFEFNEVPAARVMRCVRRNVEAAMRGVWLVTTLYLAGPMSGYPDFNYPTFNATAGLLRHFGYDVLNPTESGVASGSSWETYMRATITMMLRADGVATLPGWQESRGAACEVALAQTLGMPVRASHLWTTRKEIA